MSVLTLKPPEDSRLGTDRNGDEYRSQCQRPVKQMQVPTRSCDARVTEDVSLIWTVTYIALGCVGEYKSAQKYIT